MEYRYALEQRKPIIAFLHKDPGSLQAKRTEQTPEGKQKLDSFRELCKQKLVKYWTTAAELGSVVSRSLVRLIKDRPATGWVRADAQVDPAVLEDLLRKNRRIEDLETQLQAAKMQAPAGADRLASGDELFRVAYDFVAHPTNMPFGDADSEYRIAEDLSWNDIFAEISPLMIHEATDEELAGQLSDYLKETCAEKLQKDPELKDKELKDFTIADSDFQTIKVQLAALGLITKSLKGRSVKDRDTYWTLTPYGEQQMIQLRAIKKGSIGD
jgi:hypothetical protein